MGDAARKVLDQALALSEEEREILAVDLLASVGADAGWEEAWTAEIDRRLADVRSDPSTTVSWDEVHRDLLSKLRRR